MLRAALASVLIVALGVIGIAPVADAGNLRAKIVRPGKGRGLSKGPFADVKTWRGQRALTPHDVAREQLELQLHAVDGAIAKQEARKARAQARIARWGARWETLQTRPRGVRRTLLAAWWGLVDVIEAFGGSPHDTLADAGDRLASLRLQGRRLRGDLAATYGETPVQGPSQ